MALGYCQSFISAQYLIRSDFVYALTLTRSRFRFLHVYFRKFTTYPVVVVLGHFQNFISAHYIVKELMEFDQILHMH